MLQIERISIVYHAICNKLYWIVLFNCGTYRRKASVHFWKFEALSNGVRYILHPFESIVELIYFHT